MIERFKERSEELGLKIYQATPQEDISIFEWWREISATPDGDLYKAFPQSTWALSSFYSLFRSPRVLLYVEDSNGIWFTVWMERLEAAVVFSSWVRESMRGTRAHYRTAKLSYEIAFEMSSTLIGITKRPELLKLHEKIGYTILGSVPKLFDGQDDAWIVVLTKDAFQKGALNNENL